MTDYAPGVPMWVDVSSPDLDASRTFYSGLFGWDAYVVPEPEAGGYTTFSLGGKSVAGGAPTMSPEQPAAWSTYVHTEDADATAAAVAAAGGAVAFGPMDVMGQGRMAVFTDPEGAFFCVWQPQQHRGAEAVNSAGAFCWNELNTRNLDNAKTFYGEVFGWNAVTSEPNGTSYTEFKVDDRSIAGAMDISGMALPDVPPHWLVYFTVDNTDASLAKAQELGGRVIVPPMDIALGRFAILADPVGAVFAIIQFNASM